MANVTLDEKTLYYQWLINHNSTSTMLNALSGSGDEGSFSGVLSSVAGIGSAGSTYSAGLGGLSTIADAVVGANGIESTSSFAKILEVYMGRNQAGVSGVSDLTSDAASMAEKLSEVLEEAKETEDTNSLTYKTVQEIYEYFSGQVSARAQSLLGDAAVSKVSSAAEDRMEALKQMALRGEEFDFSAYDEMVDNSFGEMTPLT